VPVAVAVGVPGAVAGVAIGVAGGRLLSLVMRDST